MPELVADRFDEFLAAVHRDPKRTAFPWQRQLLEEVLARCDETAPWPTAIDAPTGLGKTSVLDVAVFAAAAGLPLRRVFFVVDRRIIVDEAYSHAERLQQRVRPGAAGILGQVGAQLASVTGVSGPVVSATRMRGGTTWDWRWMDRPDRFGIVVGTVDQVGSRLLFRGYGLSHRLAPIDAALVGADSVLFVDEAHLAEPMINTIANAQRLDQPEQPVCRPVTVVQLSATQRAGGGRTLGFDIDAHLAHREAARRLRAAKVLHTVTTTEKASAGVLAASVLAATRTKGDALVGVVANTVAKARAVFDRVRGVDGISVVLLTGRQRPWDRDRLIGEWSSRITVGWRNSDERNGDPMRPTVIVATQCIEVGANLDLDVLVTESAPWDSLVQRLGRVNRVGTAPSTAQVLVVHAEGANADPVYGEPRTATWEWLTGLVPTKAWKTERAAATGFPECRERPGLDVSPLALRGLRAPGGTRSRPRQAPILFPQHIEGWARTGPVPIPDAPVAPFLHGFVERRPAVRVSWRADLTEPSVEGEVDDAWKEAVATIPPRAEEELELPIAAVRAWLRLQPPIPVADDEIPVLNGKDPSRTDQQGQRLAVRIGRSKEDLEIVHPGMLRPDDRIAVPAAYGGLDRFGWAATSTAPALDIADVVARKRPVIRLNRDTLVPIVREVLGEDCAERVEMLLDALDQELSDDEALDGLPGQVPNEHPDEDPLAVILCDLAEVLTPLLGKEQTIPRRLTARPRPATRAAARLLLTASSGRRGSDSTTAGSSVSERPLLLAAHHREVGTLAARFARGLGLPQRLVDSLQQAAAWHDLGKLDPRFQTILFAGVTVNAEAALLADEPRAKSGIDPADRRARSAQDGNSYPAGGRHEALSAALVRYRLAHTDTSLDIELVEHLVAAHHGHSRPLLPPVADENRPQEIRVPEWDLTVPLPDDYGIDWTSPRRFRRLCDRYGIWGLALLESIVRLADIACSAGEYCEEAR